MVQGRRRDLGLGSARLVPLAEARELARTNRKIARKRGDPIAAKRKYRAVIPAFKAAAHNQTKHVKFTESSYLVHEFEQITRT